MNEWEGEHGNEVKSRAIQMVARKLNIFRWQPFIHLYALPQFLYPPPIVEAKPHKYFLPS